MKHVIIPLAVFILSLMASTPAILQQTYETTSSLVPNRIWPHDQRTAGNLVEGFTTIQPIKLPERFMDNLRKLEPNDKVVLGVLMATYGDRENKGSIRIGIRQGPRIVTKTIDISELQDNTYLSSSWQASQFEGWSKGSAEVFLSGLNSPANKSVTAWLVKGSPFGGAITNGVQRERGLCFSLVTQTKNSTLRIRNFGFSFLQALCLMLVAVALVRSPSLKEN